MLSKRERFQHWRGAKSDEEQQILELALLISEYVSSVNNLDTIKEEAQTKFKEFDQGNYRSWAAAVFTKLFIDEAKDQLPETAEYEKLLLTNLSNILMQMYDNWKNEATKNINTVITIIEQLIDIEQVPFKDKKQYKNFIFSSYMLFQIIALSLNELNWAAQKIASYFIDIPQMKLKFANFLQKIENRAQQLEQVEAHSDKTNSDPIKYFFNKRYLKVLSNTPLISQFSQTPSFRPIGSKPIKRDILASLAELEVDINRVSLGIENLLQLRDKKNDIEKKIENIDKLLLSLQENEWKNVGFLTFIENHSLLFEALLENMDETSKTVLLTKKKQLEEITAAPNLSSSVINGFSWVATPITAVYRTTAPQMIQDALAYIAPATIDRDCKVTLNESARVCMKSLEKELEKTAKHIETINNRLFNRDEKLKRLITHERVCRLAVLQEENEAFKEAVQTCIKTVGQIKENLHFLNNFKEKREILKDFIRVHDTFLFKICNFLSQYFSFFKTETVRMVDEAANLKKKVNKLVMKYHNRIDEELIQIEQNPFLDERIKSHIKRRLKAEEKEVSKEIRISPNKHNVRLLMDNLSPLFTEKAPILEQTNSEAVGLTI